MTKNQMKLMQIAFVKLNCDYAVPLKWMNSIWTHFDKLKKC